MYDHESTTPCECGVCKISQFDRNNYFNGKLLTSRDLQLEQRYFNEKRWLINRMVVGWGIVCGLDVYVDDHGCLYVTQGLAIDCCGRELLVCDREALSADDVAKALGADPKRYEPIEWALCLEYREIKTEQVKAASSCEKTERDYNRLRDSYRLTFRPRDEACPNDHDEDCCPYDHLGQKTSIHNALVQRSRNCPKCEECECVLLATGTLRSAGQAFEIALDQGHWKFRRVVYTNGALASLLRCFHGQLAHITEVNWTPDTHYDIARFLHLLHDGLQIRFDRPLDEASVKKLNSFRLSIFITVDDGRCPEQFLIPLQRIDYYDDTATYFFDYRCIEHDLKNSCRRYRKPAEVELTLHGDMILDQRGRALDAELIGEFPTGNGVQGGQFITYLTVGP